MYAHPAATMSRNTTALAPVEKTETGGAPFRCEYGRTAT
jgi:hypothetical protein